MIKQIHIFDLDGTVINSLHRYKTMPCNTRIDLPFWLENANKKMITKDTLLPLAKFYKECLQDKEIYVVIATCRLANKHDLKFVNEKLGTPDKFIFNIGELEKMKGGDFKGKKLSFLNNLKQFRNAEKHFWEDNKDYLNKVAEYIPNLICHYVPSKQGY